MLGIGFAFCALPIAQRLHPNEKDLKEFIERHLMFFNSHPYFANICLGACANLEEAAIRDKKFWKDLRPLTVFKERLVGPLGALGDEIFWKTLKPLAATISVFLGLVAGWIAIPVFLLVYNVPHFYVRIKGLMIGYERGFEVVSLLSLRRLEKYPRFFAASGSVVTGLVIVMAAKKAMDSTLLNPIVFVLAIIVSFFLLNYKKSVNKILLIVSALAVFLSYITFQMLKN